MTSPPPAGRLTLSWIGKDRALLGTAPGGYEWVARDDPRVTEVRLLHERDTVGDAAPGSGGAGNLLIVGDAYDALHALMCIPEYADYLRGKVKLIYIDPPFNTGQAFAQYDDALEHSVWLTMMRDRLLLIRDLLAPDGSVWVHLDDVEMAYCRVLMDEVFGRTNFLASVVWQRTSAKSLARRTMSAMHETIIVFGASEVSELKTFYLPMEEEYVAKRFTQSDERGPYDTGDLTATSYRPHLDSGQPWWGFDPSLLRRCWAPSRTPLVEAGLTDAQLATMTIRQKLEALDAAGYIHWPRGGGFPRFKKYLHNVKGRAVGDLWTDINVVNSQAVERTGFSTQKPQTSGGWVKITVEVSVRSC